eukprot:TRINITY_DN8920_c0_g1_i1.p1 TRINITY_DN8920_c0_g1~~TRINITY_DN8920_c0_g1_i1.p1  ORF type:complete len:426 (+),score=101.89 TRINITY_DN8920_c0_g1_i1:99-1376(+)
MPRAGRPAAKKVHLSDEVLQLLPLEDSKLESYEADLLRRLVEIYNLNITSIRGGSKATLIAALKKHRDAVMDEDEDDSDERQIVNSQGSSLAASIERQVQRQLDKMLEYQKAAEERRQKDSEAAAAATAAAIAQVQAQAAAAGQSGKTKGSSNASGKVKGLAAAIQTNPNVPAKEAMNAAKEIFKNLRDQTAFILMAKGFSMEILQFSIQADSNRILVDGDDLAGFNPLDFTPGQASAIKDALREADNKRRNYLRGILRALLMIKAGKPHIHATLTLVKHENGYRLRTFAGFCKEMATRRLYFIKARGMLTVMQVALTLCRIYLNVKAVVYRGEAPGAYASLPGLAKDANLAADVGSDTLDLEDLDVDDEAMEFLKTGLLGADVANNREGVGNFETLLGLAVGMNFATEANALNHWQGLVQSAFA